MPRLAENGAPSRPLAVVLVSGGLDSAVCLAEARLRYEPAVLHVNYGQRTQERELRSFEALADHYAVQRRLVTNISYLSQIGGSSLLDATMSVETGLPVGDGVPSTYVPFRNAHILCMGVSWAEVCGAQALFIGAVQEDSSGYPDCRREFYERFAEAIAEGTRPATNISLETPLIDMDKAAIVRRGQQLGVPFELTWSCYTDSDRACGVCESCRLRRRGFAQAGMDDPLSYRSP